VPGDVREVAGDDLVTLAWPATVRTSGRNRLLEVPADQVHPFHQA